MPSSQDQVWLKMWKDNSTVLREKAILWRRQNAITRIDKPSRIARAKRLGYKAKQGIIVVRRLLGSYFLYNDSIHYWFEIILADPSHPRIAKDKELRKRVLPSVA